MPSANVSQINIIDPRNRHTVYIGVIPSGLGTSNSVTVAGGVEFTIPYLGGNYGIVVHVSSTPSAADVHHLAVYGAAWDGPSVAPTDRNWSLCRGDTATGTNVLLGPAAAGPSTNQMITVLSPALAYKIAMFATNAASSPVTFRVFAFDKTYNW